MSALRRAVLALACATALGGLSGCGGLAAGEGGATAAVVTQPEPQSGNGGKQQPKVQLAKPAEGVVSVEGDVGSSLTPAIVDHFQRARGHTGLAISVDPHPTDESVAYGDLCRGATDVVDSVRLPTADELTECQRAGLQVVELVSGFAPIVLATRNERDVGTDCLTLGQVRAAFRVGSPIRAWNQLDPRAFPLRLRPVGPDVNARDFKVFGASVFGLGAGQAAAVRGDYHQFGAEDDIRTAVVDHPPGALGIFGFSYYEQYEDQLRPLEIDGGAGDACVFPSEETIASGLYPLQTTLHLTTTTRSLKRPEANAFLKTYLEQAPAEATKAELVPLPAQLQQQELALLNPNGDTSAQASGSAAGTTASSETSTTTSTSPATSTEATTTAVPTTTTTAPATTTPAGGGG